MNYHKSVGVHACYVMLSARWKETSWLFLLWQKTESCYLRGCIMQIYSKIGSLLLIACCVAYCLYTREIVLVFKASSMFTEPCNMCLAPFPMMGNGGQQHPPISKALCLCVCALNSCTWSCQHASLLGVDTVFVNGIIRAGNAVVMCWHLVCSFLSFLDFTVNHSIEYVSLLIIDCPTDWMQLLSTVDFFINVNRLQVCVCMCMAVCTTLHGVCAFVYCLLLFKGWDSISGEWRQGLPWTRGYWWDTEKWHKTRNMPRWERGGGQ